MVLIFIILVSHLGVIHAQNIGPVPQQPQSQGCALILQNGWFEMEPVGDPLLVHVRIRVIHLTDIPDSGSSFGVDIM